MKQEILIATENRGKADEIRDIFSNTGFDVKFLYELKHKVKDLEIQESAKSFEGNALIKAIIVGDILQMVTLADDSGLCVDALNGKPGVYSSRYSEEKIDAANNAKVLSEMNGLSMEERNCHYNCTVAIYDPKTKFIETVSGIWEGRIAAEPRGTWSFGYAPIFLSKEFDYKKTNAELLRENVIDINHRGKAFRQAIEKLEEYLKVK